MTAPLHPPLLGPDQAATLLDDLLYEQVLECVDLDALYHLEQSLTMLVGELEGMTEARVGDLVRSMLDRALVRLPDDIRRYLRTGPFLPFDGPDRCEEDCLTGPLRGADAGPGPRRRPPPPPAPRLKS